MKKNWFVFLLIASMLVLMLTACSGNKTTDFTQNENYKQFFSEKDDELNIELKNIVFTNIQAFNEGDAKTYCSLFSMTKDDSQFNEASFRDLRRLYDITYTVKDANATAVSGDNAQVVLTVLYSCKSLETGEVIYLSENELVYTMQRRGAKWILIEYKDKELADLTEYGTDFVDAFP